MADKKSPPDETERAKDLKSMQKTILILCVLDLIQSAIIAGLIFRFVRLVQLVEDLGQIVSGQGEILKNFIDVVNILIEGVNHIA